MIQTVCLTSWLLVNWYGPSGVCRLTDSIAVRSLSRSPGRSLNVRLARLAESARILMAVKPWAANWSGSLLYSVLYALTNSALELNVLPRYQALPLRAPFPLAPACFDTAAVLKPLPPRNCPVQPCLRASVMILAGIWPSDVMKITSGLSCTACVTYGERSASPLLNGIVFRSE